jgi:hypothetical protein
MMEVHSLLVLYGQWDPDCGIYSIPDTLSLYVHSPDYQEQNKISLSFRSQAWNSDYGSLLTPLIWEWVEESLLNFLALDTSFYCQRRIYPGQPRESVCGALANNLGLCANHSKNILRPKKDKSSPLARQTTPLQSLWGTLRGPVRHQLEECFYYRRLVQEARQRQQNPLLLAQ